MKKLLTILGAVGLTATAGATVVACGTEPADAKGDFAIKAKGDKKSLEVGETLEINIEKFADEVKGKFEKFDVAFGKEGQEKLVSVDKAKINEGSFTITANKGEVGKFDLHVTAFTVKDEEKDKDKKLSMPQDEEAPKADAKSQVLHLEVTAIDLSKAFTDEEKNLGEFATDAEATAKVDTLIAGKTNLKDKVKVEVTKEHKEITVSPKDAEDKTLTGKFVFTFGIKEDSKK